MPFLDFSHVSAVRVGTAVVPYYVPLADIGRGDDSADSGLENFIDGEGAQIKDNASRLGILVTNGSDDQLHVKIITSQQVDGLEVEDRIVSIASGDMKLIGPFNSTYHSTNRVDSAEAPAVQSTNYIQLQFAVDSDGATETLELGDVSIIGIVIPAS